jgi:protein SCO1/2
MLPLCLLGIVALGDAGSASRLAVIRQAPDFALTNQAGETLRLADVRGKVLLVGFIFTTCNGTCPATTHRMSQVQQEVKARGLADQVRLLSISLDPVRDTPEALRGYASLYDVDIANWSFLTGPADQVGRVIAAWGMWARPADQGQLDHPSRVFLLDRRGRIREIYNLSFLKPAWVVQDMAALVGEAP